MATSEYSILRNASLLSPQNMICLNQECSLGFRALVEKLYVLNKTADKKAVTAKDHYDQFLKAVKFEHEENFLKFNFKEGRLDKFLGIYLSSKDQYNELWTVCKIVFGLSHGQSNFERRFSASEEVKKSYSTTCKKIS